MSIMGFLNIVVTSSITNFYLHKIPDEVLGTTLTSRKNVFVKKSTSKRLPITASCFSFTITLTEVDTAHTTQMCCSQLTFRSFSGISRYFCIACDHITSRSANTAVREPPGPAWRFNCPLLMGQCIL